MLLLTHSRESSFTNPMIELAGVDCGITLGLVIILLCAAFNIISLGPITMGIMSGVAVVCSVVGLACFVIGMRTKSYVQEESIL